MVTKVGWDRARAVMPAAAFKAPSEETLRCLEREAREWREEHGSQLCQRVAARPHICGIQWE